jgi:hypothetical protein
LKEELVKFMANENGMYNIIRIPGNLQELSDAFHFPGLVGKTATVKNKNK